MVNGCLPLSHLIFPCKICNNNVNDKDHAIQCDIYNFWVHIKCNNFNYIDYKYLRGNSDPWYCITCSSSIFPFNCLNNKKFASLFISQSEANSSLLLNPSPKLTNLVNQFNNNTIIDNNTMLLTILFILNTLILMRFRN